MLDRRALMLAAQILALVVSVLLTVFTYSGVMTPWLLLTFTFLVGCGNAIYGPAWQSSVGEVVPRAELPQAVALNSLGFNIARTVGPAIGGLIVAAFGSQAAFLVNSISYVGLIIVLFSWKRPVEQRPFPPESIPSAMMAGLRYVALSPSIQSVLVRAVVFGMAASSIWALMPLVARDLIQGGPSIYGLLLGAFGVGAVLSALSSTRLRAAFTTGQIVTIATLFFATGSIIAAFSTSLPITMIGMVMCGGGWVLALSTFNISVQLSVPRWVVGRSVAIYQIDDLRRHGAGQLAVGSHRAPFRPGLQPGAGGRRARGLDPAGVGSGRCPASPARISIRACRIPQCRPSTRGFPTARAMSSSPSSIAWPRRMHRSSPARCASWPRCASATARAAGR